MSDLTDRLRRPREISIGLANDPTFHEMSKLNVEAADRIDELEVEVQELAKLDGPPEIVFRGGSV